ncbi:MAG: hypothetical protein ACI8ZM_003840 [Crocinitomix sp.]|jgi:hypothetical protein
MKLFLSLFILCSLSAFGGEIYLKIQLVDIRNGLGLEEGNIDLGHTFCFEHRHSGFYVPSIIQNYKKENLTDTVFIKYLDYSFEMKPLIQQDYVISTDNNGAIYMDVTIYGVPYIENFIIELPIAKSKKTEIDSVMLQIYSKPFSTNASLKLMNLQAQEVIEIEQKWVGKNNIEQYIQYSDLEDGYFELEEDGISKRYPFDSMDWMRPIYLGNQIGTSSQELALLTELIDHQEDQLLIRKELESRYTIEIDAFRTIIDSLETEIDFLKNGPEAPYDGPIEVPMLPIEKIEEEEVVFDFVNSDLNVSWGMDYGFDAVLSRLTTILTKETVKYSGIAKIEITVSKEGEASYHLTGCNQAISDQIEQFMVSVVWIPQYLNGKIVTSHCEILLRFFKN